MLRVPKIPSLLVVVSYSAAVLLLTPGRAFSEDEKIDYNRDIRPIFSDKCYKCHGNDPKKREGGLRLDTLDGVLSELDSGERGVVPGDLENSEIHLRVSSKDEDLRMPPVDSDKTLTPKEIEMIKKWIEQGAAWREHWSFTTPTRPAVPAMAGAVNPIDHFIRARLEKEGLKPSPPADKHTLIRRVTFDLTGLPPTPAEVDAFVKDQSADAYEKLVDRLLKSPRYGEHRGRYWLDAARYGDTHGLHLDNERSIWPYRDWVVRALNNNMPFDQFTLEQMAGDLLPNPTLQQLIATGFNRCNVTTSEGGSIAEEYRVRYAADRVETMGTVYLGLTLNCTVCHEHKFDPISQQEFYRFFDYFANTQDAPMDGNAILPPPSVKVPSPQQTKQLAERKANLAAIEKSLRGEIAKVNYSEPEQTVKPAKPEPRELVWIDDELPNGAKAAGDGGDAAWQWGTAPEYVVYSGKKSHRRSAAGLSQHLFTAADPLTLAEGDKFFTYVYLDPANPPKEIMLQFNDGTWDHRAYWGDNAIDWGVDKSPSRFSLGKLPELGKWVRLEVDAKTVGLRAGSKLNGWAFTQFDGTVYWDKAGVVSLEPDPTHFDSQLAWEAAEKAKQKSDLAKDLLAIVKLEKEKRNEQQAKKLQEHFIARAYAKTKDIFGPLHKKLADANKQLKSLNDSIPSTLVMKEKDSGRVDTFLLIRGEYDKPDKKQKLTSGVPVSLHPMSKDAPRNRLGLAQWLIDPANPLTSRVTVNRFWQQYFGIGIVKTSEDFGSQGEWPSHENLIDFLAVEFVESGWDIKQMQKLIVMSATYQQSSHVTPELYNRDPENRLLARGPRFRLDAETIRDNALAISGLLIEKIGGKGVRPYQPEGVWKAVGYTGSNTANFTQDHGEDLYRRSLYTFLKRTAPPPSMATFDAPSREQCTVRRARTNTPLQALNQMNDVQFVEAARHFAQRIMKESGGKTQDRISLAMQLATSRPPNEQETKLLAELFQKHLAYFQKNKEAAEKLISVGELKRDESLDAVELAAWTMLANLILNLNETITKG